MSCGSSLTVMPATHDALLPRSVKASSRPRRGRRRRGVPLIATVLAAAIVTTQTTQRPVAAEGEVGEISASADALQQAVRRGWLHRDLPTPPAGKIVFPVEPKTGCALYWTSFGAPRDGGSRAHEGTDIMGLGGQAVYAVADGVLTRRYTNTGSAGYGWSLHDPVTGITYKYFHLAADPVGRAQGQTVRVGDVLGYVGDSGTVAGNYHLHFEYRINSTPSRDGPAVDPLPFFDTPVPPCRFY